MRGYISRQSICLQYRNYIVVYRDNIMLVGIVIDRFIVCFKRVKKAFINLKEALNAMELELRERRKC
ncbi:MULTISPECIES: hypothetical protein [Clostridium]|uniref:hypothetical protein n=1 Tax=Clostridium TaxID=1485 RepID=UPI0008257776|nr:MULTISPECIES: hypothetical protein [Clostridium]PJI10224.1 hypothetical protein CUB90_21135 [Clostridium sp. CT7]